MTLQKAILMYRVMHNLSMKKFAQTVGVTLQTIYNIETLGTKPSKMTAAKIKLVLGDEYPDIEEAEE